MGSKRRVILLPTLGVVVLAIAAAVLLHAGEAADVANGQFARASGTRFTVGGRPFYSNGFNAYWLMYMASDPGDRSKAAGVLQQAASLRATLVRTWAFSDGGYRPLQKSPGVYNEDMFMGLDFVIAEAKKRGLYLILSLVNNWDGFGGKKQYVQWARDQGHNLGSDDDFFRSDVTKQFYKNHVKARANIRYADSRPDQSEQDNRSGVQGRSDHLCMGAHQRASLPERPLRKNTSGLGHGDGRVREIRGSEPHGGDRAGRVLRRVDAQELQPGLHRRHRLHRQQPRPRCRLRHDPLLPRPMGVRREQRRAGGVHEEVDGRPHPRLGGGAPEAAAGDGVRVVGEVERVHGGGAGRLLPHGVRRGVRVGAGGRRVRRWPLLAGDGARDGELDRRLRGGARAQQVYGRRRRSPVRQDRRTQPGLVCQFTRQR
ncbi:Os02g0766900 [Oryza sativa Japonica Group]|uniref:mannan endo-1,4-beta-mannosidase n=1 Tax=Oryza sativa subsp. japonica TaxID=39947 RepID=A0A0P0VQ05_ORYSJ|nr:Os02g0766900 [Oryza sativa Japonica Group]